MYPMLRLSSNRSTKHKNLLYHSVPTISVPTNNISLRPFLQYPHNVELSDQVFFAFVGPRRIPSFATQHVVVAVQSQLESNPETGQQPAVLEWNAVKRLLETSFAPSDFSKSDGQY